MAYRTRQYNCCVVRVCLVGAANLSNNPRLLREADLLAKQHDIRVVCQGSSEAAAEADQRLMARRSWHLERVDDARGDWVSSDVLRPRWLHSVLVRARRRLAEEAFHYVKTTKVAEYSVCTGYSELRRLASAESADWFIAHTQPALPTAVAAAHRWNAKLGFDCEDLLAEAGDKFSEANRLIEQKYLHRCDYITATSNAMAEHLANAYKVPSPVVLYNVFPLSLAEGVRTAERATKACEAASAFGSARRLAQIVACRIALKPARVSADQVEIHLRGRVPEAHRAILLDQAQRWGVAACVHLHPRVDPEDLIVPWRSTMSGWRWRTRKPKLQSHSDEQSFQLYAGRAGDCGDGNCGTTGGDEPGTSSGSYIPREMRGACARS